LEASGVEVPGWYAARSLLGGRFAGVDVALTPTEAATGSMMTVRVEVAVLPALSVVVGGVVLCVEEAELDVTDCGREEEPRQGIG
jgi:hypothetical protein